jgi:GntR family phosphonate transport system transcriptional regulator
MTPNTESPISDAADAGAAPRRWETIAAALRDDIAKGLLKPGERLPNEATLAERFEVNRHTLRQAMQALARDGFVRVAHGSGTYVRELVLDYALQRRTRMTQNLAAAGEQAQRELMGHERVRGGEWAKELGLGAKGEVQLMYTRASVRGRPIGISTAAFVLPRLDGIIEAFQARRSITTALAALGVHDYTRSRSTVSCRLPTPAEADALARSAAQPVLVVRFVNVDESGVPVEAGCTLFASDAVQLTVEPDAGDLG